MRCPQNNASLCRKIGGRLLERFEPTPKMGVVGSLFVPRYDIRDAIASVVQAHSLQTWQCHLIFEMTGHIPQLWEDQAPGKRSFRPA